METLEKKFKEADEKLLAQMLVQIPTPVMAVNKDLQIIYINEAGRKTLPKKYEDLLGTQCCDLFHSKHCNIEDCGMRKSLASGKSFKARNEAMVNNNKIQYEYYTVPLKDETGEVIGGLEFIVDITEQVQYEERLREQSHSIRQMSTPTIKLWEGILVLPVIGIVDSMRAQYMMETMLNKIVETYSKVIILDIQGVAAVDTAVANHLIKITKATKLLGCECILSGISPAVAQTVIQLGIDMDTIKTKSTLKDALSEAFSIMNMEVRKK